jgi:hypothetical protein
LQLDQHLSAPGESAKDLLAARERQKKEAKRRKAKRSGKHAGLATKGEGEAGVKTEQAGEEDELGKVLAEEEGRAKADEKWKELWADNAAQKEGPSS